MSSYSPSRRLALASGALAAVLLGSGAWFALGAGSGDDAPASSATDPMSGSGQSAPAADHETYEPQSSGPASEGELDGPAAAQRAEWVLTTMAQALADPAQKGRYTDLSSVASGFALGEFESLAAQYADEGLHQEGSAVIEDPVIVESAADGTSIVLQACVDSSGVRILNEAGTDVRGDGSLDRALTLFTFVLDDGAWKLDKQGFTDDPAC